MYSQYPVDDWMRTDYFDIIIIIIILIKKN